MNDDARASAAGGSPAAGAVPRRAVICAAAIAAASIAAVTGCSATRPTAASPTLGQLSGVFAHGDGFGEVKPARIFNGGDPTGLVTYVVWKSWGGARALATGESDYVGPSQSVATGTEEPVTVVAFDLGSCDGKLMYRAVEWYFPQHGQDFDPGQYENICTGSYVPGS
jgi:hypothetical protein